MSLLAFEFLDYYAQQLVLHDNIGTDDSVTAAHQKIQQQKKQKIIAYRLSKYLYILHINH